MSEDQGDQVACKPWNLRYACLLISAAAQLISLAITWPLWNVRSDIPHLPVADFGLPEVSFGWLLVITLAVVPFRPKLGVWLHFAVMFVACLMDQMRAQPQFLATWLLMFASLKQLNQNYVRWFLCSLWIWAGLHKALSPNWNAERSWNMTTALGLEPENWAMIVAVTVAATEILTGLLAWWKPKWGAFACAMLHIGIAIYLSPLFSDWNYSVLPWNLATAIVGFWILWTCDTTTSKNQMLAYVAFLTFPAGFYLGVVDHGYAHVLYSGSMPKGLITRVDGSVETITGWGELAIPFPNERRTLKQRFDCVAEEGDRLHILDPRIILDDLYFVRRRSSSFEISRDTFLLPNSKLIAGVELDSRHHVFHLTRAGAKMLKRKREDMVYAIEFSPEHFSPEQLDHLQYLPNIEEIQLSGTSVSDADLHKLVNLSKLVAVGLDSTSISDQGIDTLEKSKTLEVIQAEGSQVSNQRLLNFHNAGQPNFDMDALLPP